MALTLVVFPNLSADSTDSYAAPIERLAWKHSRQNTGRPCVGLKGTVVSLPHCEQVVFVSALTCPLAGPPFSTLLALHPLQRFGSFLKPLSAKNICSPAVKTNSAPHSLHFRTLSWNSMAGSLDPARAGGSGRFFTMGLDLTLEPFPEYTKNGPSGPKGEELERIPNISA
jgi:hypothetical protein